MMRRGCPTEHELLARAHAPGPAEEGDGIDAHLAECAECRIVVSELVRTSFAERPAATSVRADEGDPALAPARPRVTEGELIDGKYRVTRVLGTGGMGLVVEAAHDVLGTRVAIKVPSFAMREDAEVRARLLVEARTVALLEGDYVGRVLDAGVLRDGFPFVVFERLEGRTLAERLRDDGQIGAVDAVDAVIEACAGLAEAHAAGIVHRDVKPSNLFEARRADGSLRIRVIDFGIAKTGGGAAGPLTRSGMILGTPAYMAPEQVASSRAVDARADVWALGIVLVELLTATPPTVASFAATFGDDAGAIVRAIMTAGASRRDADAIARVIGRCLRADPSERFGTVADLARALEPFAGARGRAALASIGGSHVPAAVAARPSVVRRAIVVASAALVAAVVAAVFVASRPAPIAAARAVTAPSAAPPAGVTMPVREPAPIQSPVIIDAQRAASSVVVRPPARSPKAPPSAAVPAVLADPGATSPARDPNGLGDRK
jgi:serine/threonine-protein kinase